jgi:hypothetical protein
MLKLVDNAGDVALKSYTVWAAVVGLLTPEAFEWLASHTDVLPFDEQWKMYIRVAALMIIPIVRLLKQKSIPPETATTEELPA